MENLSSHYKTKSHSGSQLRETISLFEKKMQVAITLGFLLVAACLLSQQVLAIVTPQQIQRVPGYNGFINFAQYAGFVPVNTTAQRNLFYWFVESQSNPSSAPVILWLNGGTCFIILFT